MSIPSNCSNKLQTVAAELGLQNYTKKKKLTKLRDASEKDLKSNIERSNSPAGGSDVSTHSRNVMNVVMVYRQIEKTPFTMICSVSRIYLCIHRR